MTKTTTKIANVRWQSRDWKESIDVKWLQKTMKEVQAMGHGCQMLDGSDAVNLGDDSMTTVVCPANVQWKPITESDVLGYVDEMHVAKDGTLSFKFLAEYGLPETGWLTEKEAQKHVDELIEADEKAWELKQKKEAAKKKRRK